MLQHSKRGLALLVILLTLSLGLAGMEAGPVRATDGFADPAFQRVWQRTDLPVAANQAGRTWFWGPQPGMARLEQYGGAGQQRQVQYFDKSRMEINNPQADRTTSWFVTNGLLARELVSGYLQLGDTQFEKRLPADIPVAGDSDDSQGPTYASLNAVTSLAPGQNQAQSALNNFVNTGLNRSGQAANSTLGETYGVRYANFEPQTAHNIPGPFWDFLNSTGPTQNPDGRLVTTRLFDPLYFVTGLPLSEAYWVRAKVAGQVKDVLVQVFERRVLTYTPSNQPQWRVEMGNIGQHYYQWRYGPTNPPAYDQRFAITITGGPDKASLDYQLAQVGGAKNWYSFDPYEASEAAKASRVMLIKTGRNYLGDKAALTALARSMPAGTTYLIGNEPNVPGQDDATPADYASQYRTIRDTLRAVDPTARMVGPNVLNWNYTCDGCPGYNQADKWVDQMLQEYRNATNGQEFDADIWGIHTYGLNWSHLPLTNAPLDISQTVGLRKFLTAQPAQASKPIWITEFGVIWGYDGISWSNSTGSWRATPTGAHRTDAMRDYLRTYGQWLLANAEDNNVGRWFVYTSYGQPEPYTDVFTGISLFKGGVVGSPLSEFGELYRSLAMH